VTFEPVLDEAFGITHSKQQIRPMPHLVEAIAPDVEAIDPPPMKWSVLRYGFELEEDRDGEQEAPA
jgi:hypothetical protein